MQSASKIHRAVVQTLESRRLLSAYTITDIGEFPTSVDNGSHDATPTGVNDQGAVVGYTTRNYGGQFAAFEWTAAGGMIKLGSINAMNLDDPSNVTIANGISSDGTVVGESDALPVIWSASTTVASELALPDGYTTGNAEAIDGSVFAGQVFNIGTGYTGIIWEGQSNDLEPASNNVDALGMSGGSLNEVGTDDSASGLSQAYAFGAGIGYLPGDGTSTATGANDAGQVVGYSSATGDNPVTEAFIYTPSGGMQGLGFLGSGQNSQASAINDSGLVVGQSYVGNNAGDAFIWSAATGMQDLNSLIPANSGWTLQDATAISPGGLIVGTGINPQGQDAGFLLQPKSSQASGAGALTPTVAKTTLPTALVAGTSAHGSATVELANSSAAAQKGSATVNLYLTSDGAIDGSSILIGTTKRSLNVGVGKTIGVSVGIKALSATIPSGSYELLADVVDAGGTTDGTAGPTITFASPYLSLAPTLEKLTTPATAVSGYKTKDLVAVKISNGGNIESTGATTVAIFASPDGTVAAGTQIASVTKSLKIQPGDKGFATVSVPLSLIPDGLAGTYQLIAQVTDPKGGSSLVVLSPNFAIQAANLSLTPAIVSFEPAQLGLTGEVKTTISLTLTNTGNVPAGTAGDINSLQFSPGLINEDGTFTAGIGLFGTNTEVLQPGKVLKITMHFITNFSSYSLKPPAGTYFPTLKVMLDNSSYTNSVTGSEMVTVG